jgi:hypothetical protein
LEDEKQIDALLYSAYTKETMNADVRFYLLNQDSSLMRTVLENEDAASLEKLTKGMTPEQKMEILLPVRKEVETIIEDAQEKSAGKSAIKFAQLIIKDLNAQMKEDLYGEKGDLIDAVWMNNSAELDRILEGVSPHDRFNSLMNEWNTTEFTDGPLRSALVARFSERLEILLEKLGPSQKYTLLNAEIRYAKPIIEIAIEENNPHSQVHKSALEILKDLPSVIQKKLFGYSVQVEADGTLSKR